MEFSYSPAFWGFLALAIPTIILLLSKKQQETIEFGTLTFLDESESKKARSILPSQWLLWLIRVAILSLLVLLLAKPLFSDVNRTKKIYIEDQVFEDPNFSEILDGLPDDVIVFNSKSLWTFIRTLNTAQDSAVVYTRNFGKSFIGTPDSINDMIDWRIVPMAESIIIKDTMVNEQQAIELEIESTDTGMTWKQIDIGRDLELDYENIDIQIVSSLKQRQTAENLSAVFKSYQQVLPLTLNFESEAPHIAIVVDTQTTIAAQKYVQWDFFEGPLQLSNVAPSHFEIKGNLSPDHLKSSQFPLDLASILMEEQIELNRLDLRLAEAPLVASLGTKGIDNMKSERKYYWWIAILLLVLIERFYSRKFGAT